MIDQVLKTPDKPVAHDPLIQKSIVFSVASDPEPKQSRFHFHRKSAVVKANSDRPVLANFLEVERWVRRVGLEQFIASIC